ncbi:hypothetical protein C806_02336 [Lachnospiraceae bacterium 3-1]|nr:hypothetical protein C806_02336 [Lachnospiraceae bacterium 3-1]
MEKDEVLLAKRFMDLSRQAQQKNIVLFSDFLNLNELNIFRQQGSELYSDFQLSGGYELSERQMIAFLPDALCYDWNFPISCLKITPVNIKFAEKLNHRDVLGSLMNLGIERSMLGDILVDETLIYVFCHKKISEYLMEALTRIRHTTVLIELAAAEEVKIEPQKESGEGIISSNRLDSVIACICKVSRSQASQWIRSGRVFINNKEILQTTYECKPLELISVRSFGRFRFLGDNGETRKGRLKIQFEKYL